MKTTYYFRRVLVLTLLCAFSFNSFSQLPSRVLVGYWHNWDALRLKDIDDRYNVLMLSFLEADKNGNQDDNSINDLEFTPYSASQLLADIPVVQSEGKKVIVSIGGANGSFRLSSTAEKNTFVQKVKDFITTYGVDGIDIDLERQIYMCSSGGTLNSPETWMQNLIDGVKELLTWYQGQYGKKMILTSAPEVAYTVGGISPWGSCKGSFLPFVEQLRDDIDLLMIQLYNSGDNYSIKYPGSQTTYAQGTADFIITQTELAIEGFSNNNSAVSGTYSGLPASKIVVALPASSCSGGGYASTATIKSAMEYLMGCGSQPGSYTLSKSYPDLRGLMTWSANNDAASCGGVYSFAQVYEDLGGCFSVGKDEVQLTKLNLFPNPALNSITVNANNQTGLLNIKNMSGQTVLSQQIAQNTTTIDVSKLAAGVYSVNLNNAVQKLVIK